MNERISLLEGRPFYFKLFVLIVLILFGSSLLGGLGYFTISNIFGLTANDISSGLAGEDGGIPTNAVRVLQAFMSLGMFLVPALAYSQISQDREIEFFGFNKNVPIAVWGLVILLMFAISPFIDGIVFLNYNLPYPDFISAFVESLIAQQEMLSAQMEKLTEMSGLTVFFINLLVIAIIPAIGEEWLFRGVIQKLFKEHFRSKHKAIWLTAFFFALLHQSVFYFLGLWVLGALLGYLKEWSGNIWVPVLAHFINNSLILVVIYFAPDLMGKLETITFEWQTFLPSLFGSALLIYIIYKLLSRFNSNEVHSQITKEETLP
jgi:membrane protease YdiL (CAAX protease family)